MKWVNKPWLVVAKVFERYIKILPITLPLSIITKID